VAPYRYERPTRTFFVLDLLLDLEDGTGRLDIERDSNGHYVDLHRVVDDVTQPRRQSSSFRGLTGHRRAGERDDAAAERARQ